MLSAKGQDEQVHLYPGAWAQANPWNEHSIGTAVDQNLATSLAAAMSVGVQVHVWSMLVRVAGWPRRLYAGLRVTHLFIYAHLPH